MEFIKSNLWEVKNSSSLRYLGIALTIAHMLTLWIWNGLPIFQGEAAICWSFFPQCNESFFLTAGNIQIIFNIYTACTLITLATFLVYRLVGLGIFTLFLATIFNFTFYVYDVNLASNDNLMLLFLSAFFVLIPQKVRLAKATIISTYVAWGLLKINKEWLAGYWLNQHLADLLPIKGIEWIAAISLFAEIVVPLLLLSKQIQRFASGVLLLLVFSILKGYIIGEAKAFMHCLFILFFVVSFFEAERTEREKIYRSFIRPEPSRLWIWAAMVAFWLVQLLPHTILKDRKLELPIVFQKFPIPVECRHHTLAYYNNGVKHLATDLIQVPSRVLRCKPQVYFDGVKKLCETSSREQDFKAYASFFLWRSISDKDYLRIFETNDVCTSDYSSFKKIEGF